MGGGNAFAPVAGKGLGEIAEFWVLLPELAAAEAGIEFPGRYRFVAAVAVNVNDFQTRHDAGE